MYIYIYNIFDTIYIYIFILYLYVLYKNNICYSADVIYLYKLFMFTII